MKVGESVPFVDSWRRPEIRTKRLRLPRQPGAFGGPATDKPSARGTLKRSLHGRSHRGRYY
jgi:hypothetical protein